jgi:large subunit ribosomal protein L13
MIVIDANEMIVGRIAAAAAEKSLLNEEVIIINCEKAIISGSKESVIAHYKQKYDRGVPRKGPFIPRMPDRFFRRIVKGMLPMAKTRGKEAFKRVMCYIGVPEEAKGKESMKVLGAEASKLPSTKYIVLGDLCKALGSKWKN